jgi:transposase
LGRSRGGFTTKIHAVVDLKGRPLHVTLTPGKRHDMVAADEHLEHAQGRALIGDRGYDSDRLARKIRRRGKKVLICCNPTRKRKRRRLDPKLYRHRFRVECFFHDIKRFRAVASRYDKTAPNYLATVELACAWRWLN